MLKRILLGLGGTPYTASEIQFAIDIASHHHAEVTAATVMDLARISDIGPVPLGGSAAAATLTQHRMEQAQEAIDAAIRQFNQRCSEATIRTRVLQEAGNPQEELFNLWRYHDLTLLSLQSLFEYGVVRDPRNLITKIIRHGVKPVLATPREYRTIRKVLIAYDGTMHAAAAMQRFIQLRPVGEIDIEVVCFHFTEENAKPLLRDAASYCELHGMKAATALRPEEPKEGLLKYAEESKADLIVMGCGEHGRLLSHLLGSTTLHAVEHSQLPLFLMQ
ncbi:MAG TPA: universal stress protein [Phycisphaerales bacterium]|nr:universal stress protein [Phycisphaerales bacterium]